MDSRERVRTALSGKRPDRVPFALGFFSQSLYGENADELFGSDVRYVEFAPLERQDRLVAYLETIPARVHVGSLSQLRNYAEWDYHPASDAKHRLAGVRTVGEWLPGLLPDLSDSRRHAKLKKQVDELHGRGLAVAGSPPHLGGELFETAWRLRGFDQFMKDLIKQPDLVDYIVDQLAAMARENAVILARAGIDVLLLDDDVAYNGGLLISPSVWRRFFKPRLGRIIEAGREESPDLLVFYHSDGDFTALVGDLVEVGINAINPVAPDCMDAVAIRRRFGNGLALWGTVGTAMTWDRGTPEQVREEVRQRIATLSKAGLMLAPAYDLDFTPRTNVSAFVDAVKEFG